MTSAEFFDGGWRNAVGAELADMVKPVSVDFTGVVTITPIDLRVERTPAEIRDLSDRVRASLPSVIDAVRVRRVVWVRPLPKTRR